MSTHRYRTARGSIGFVCLCSDLVRLEESRFESSEHRLEVSMFDVERGESADAALVADHIRRLHDVALGLLGGAAGIDGGHRGRERRGGGRGGEANGTANEHRAIAR